MSENRTIEPMRCEDIGAKVKYVPEDGGHINFWDDRATMLAWATGKIKAQKKEQHREYRELKKTLGL